MKIVPARQPAPSRMMVFSAMIVSGVQDDNLGRFLASIRLGLSGHTTIPLTYAWCNAVLDALVAL